MSLAELPLRRISFHDQHRALTGMTLHHGPKCALQPPACNVSEVPGRPGPSTLRRPPLRSHSVGMFIRYFLDLPLPFEDAEARLLAAPEVWVPGLARDAEDGGEHLLVEVGFPVDDHRVGKEVQIELGTPFRIPSKTILPLTWTATGPGRLFPSLEADLEIAALGQSRTQLSISARYLPPLGAVGRALDRALLHRVAEATLKDFLDRVGERLGAETGALT